MPYWGWIALLAGLSVLLYAAIYSVVGFTHTRRHRRGIHTDPANLADPLPLDTADSMTARELEEERANDRTRARVTPER